MIPGMMIHGMMTGGRLAFGDFRGVPPPPPNCEMPVAIIRARGLEAVVKAVVKAAELSPFAPDPHRQMLIKL